MKFNERMTLLLLRAVTALGILIFALMTAGMLVRFSRSPERMEPPEPRLPVRVSAALPGEATVLLSAHGVLQPLRRAELAAEIPGRIQEMPRLLRAGDRVEAGELLLRLDPREMEAAAREARADAELARNRLALLDIQMENERRQLALATRARDLAEAEHRRVRTLLREEHIGSASQVDAAEQALTQASVQLVLIEQAVAMHPARRTEAEALLQAAEGRLARMELNVERTELRAPFAGRLQAARAHAGEQIAPGQALFTLVDDEILEMLVPLEAAEVRAWLPFEPPAADAPGGWFPPLPELPVHVRWSADGGDLHGQGRLQRVVDFDSTTRTVTLAVRLEQGPAGEGELPFTAGMFCHAEIPGRTLKGVYTLPRSAVTFDARVYLADAGDRLRTVQVSILHARGDDLLVEGGLQPGDRVITTRLIAPLEGALLDILEN